MYVCYVVDQNGVLGLIGRNTVFIIWTQASLFACHVLNQVNYDPAQNRIIFEWSGS